MYLPKNKICNSLNDQGGCKLKIICSQHDLKSNEHKYQLKPWIALFKHNFSSRICISFDNIILFLFSGYY